MRQFSNIRTEINEKNISFYAYIGITSVRFATLESLIIHVIEKLINSDDDVISSTLIEKNSLESNLNLLVKINRRRGYQEERLNKIISQIRPLKNKRNLFIHGVWSDVIFKDNIEYMQCSNHKHLYQKLPDAQQWSRYKSDKVLLVDLQNIINELDTILIQLKSILEELADEKLS